MGERFLAILWHRVKSVIERALRPDLRAGGVLILMELLWRCRWEPGEDRGISLERGQCVFGYRELAQTLCLPIQHARTIISNTHKAGILTRKSTRDGTIVTIRNYEGYIAASKKSNTRSNTPEAPKPTRQDAKKPHLTTREEEKQEKNKTSNSSFMERFLTKWNALAEKHGLSKLRSCETKAIKDPLIARFKDTFFLENWEKALEVLPQSEFLLGKTEGGWKITPEFFLRDGKKGLTVERILNGEFGIAKHNSHVRNGETNGRNDYAGQLDGQFPKV